MRIPSDARFKRKQINEASLTVDVVVPAFRRTTYIGEAIESVLAQTIDRWQLVIVDNGPGNGAVEHAVTPFLSDPRVSYMSTGHEIALAENWTRAINLGTSPFVALLNDDDRWHPDFLRLRIEALEAHPDCGFAFGEWIQIDDAGAEVTRAIPRFAEGVVSRLELARALTTQNIVVPPAILVRRKAYDEIGAFFDPSWHYCDWEMWARIASRYPAYYLALQDSDYRRHATTNTVARHETPDRLVAMIEHIEHIFESEVEGFALSRVTRARNRSRILLHSAGDVHQSAGWDASGPLYRRSLREFPPSIFDETSVSMLGQTVIGRRGSTAVARALRSIGLLKSSGASRVGR